MTQSGVSSRADAQQIANGGDDAFHRAMGFDQPPKAASLGGQRRHEVGKTGFMQMAGDLRQRPCQRTPVSPGADQDVFTGMAQKFPGIRLVHHRKVRRHTRFQRKPAEKRLAEGVNGLDVHAAGRVQHPREQLAGANPLDVLRPTPEKMAQFDVEFGLGQGRPTAELSGDAGVHLGRRRLGVGQTEDAFRPGSGQHQPEHAVGQHLGLSGARRRHDPYRRAGVGGAALRAVGIHRYRRQCHQSSSSPPADHSLTRARCS